MARFGVESIRVPVRMWLAWPGANCSPKTGGWNAVFVAHSAVNSAAGRREESPIVPL